VAELAGGPDRPERVGERRAARTTRSISASRITRSAFPSTGLYIVVGGMTVRFRRVTPVSVQGLNRSGIPASIVSSCVQA
jgi:hypothetical protein